ncbi:MAG: GDYXXLXY domain-containing protein [Chloroflexota bacterium]
MSDQIRLGIFWLTLVALLLFAGRSIVQTERAIADGETVFVELAPVDPRSLIQGDYMTLGYDIPGSFELGDRGQLVIEINVDKTATFLREAREGEVLPAGERLINYQRQGGRQVIIGTDAFFFEEGTAELYADARYGEFRLAENGTPILVGLRDDKLNRLGVGLE